MEEKLEGAALAAIRASIAWLLFCVGGSLLLVSLKFAGLI